MLFVLSTFVEASDVGVRTQQMLDYDSRVEEERRMWQPLLEEEQLLMAKKVSKEEERRRRWAQSFPRVDELAVPEGVTLHADGSRLYNELLLLRAADREWCAEHRYELTPSIVVAEILRFIDSSPSCSRAVAPAPEEPLFTTIGQELRVSKRYQPVRDSRGRKRHGYNMFATGMFYLDTRLQLDNIQRFVDDSRTAEQTNSHWIPRSVQALAAFAQRFLVDHKKQITALQSESIDSVCRLVSRTHDTRGRVDLVYKLVEPFRGERRWSHELVDKLWAYVFSFTIEPLVIADYQGRLLARLQSELLYVFLLFADSLYSFGRVPAELNDEFVFYEPPEDVLASLDSAGSGVSAAAAAAAVSGSLSTTVTGTTVINVHQRRDSNASKKTRVTGGANECMVAVRDARCRLWDSDDFLSSLLTGVQTRARLGPLDALDRVYSRAFAAQLEQAADADAEPQLVDRATNHSSGRPLSFVTIRAALLAAARCCTRTLTEQFMAEFSREHRLRNVLNDAKSIFTGAALCSYAGSLRGGAAVRAIEVREAFSRSLVDAKIPIERRHRWGVDTEQKYGRVVCRLEWPLGYVVHGPLLALLGDARHFILSLLRCAEIIMDVQCDVEHPVAEDCRRPFLLLMRNLLQLITVISELFYKQAQVLVDRYFARIDASTTVDDARGHADALHDRLRDLVGSSGIRKMVRELVDMFCKMAEEIHLFLLSGKITSMEVYKWSKVVERERGMLLSMGENMTNNVLADLVTMLKVR